MAARDLGVDAVFVEAPESIEEMQAVAEEVELVLKHDEGLLPKGGEGRREGDWILLDYLDCVLHVFTPETRQFYRLEDLWGDVPAVELEVAAS